MSTWTVLGLRYPHTFSLILFTFSFLFFVPLNTERRICMLMQFHSSFQVTPPEQQIASPAPEFNSTFLSSGPDPKFELKGTIFPSAPPLSSDSAVCDVYNSDKLNFRWEAQSKFRFNLHLCNLLEQSCYIRAYISNRYWGFLKLRGAWRGHTQISGIIFFHVCFLIF